jgi:transposase-like protein
MEKQIKKSKVYSESLKQLVLSEVKAGVGITTVAKKYGITGSMTIYKWCKKYGIETVKKEMVELPLEIFQTKETAIIVSEKKENKKPENSTDNKLKLLEYELALYKKLVEIAKRDYDLDLLKKLDTKQSKK